MKKKSKILIATSAMALLAAGGIAIGTTTALFTRQTTSNVHINSGSLDVGFYLKQMIVDVLDPATGAIIEDKEIDLAHTEPYSQHWRPAKNAIDLGPQGYQGNFTFDNFMPSMKGKLVFVVENNSAIAIDIIMNGTKAGTWGEFNPQKTPGTAMEEADLAVLLTTTPWSTLTTVNKGASVEGTLEFTFDKDAGNEYQGCAFTIDSIITATQVSAHNS
ncbi:MAG: hypothetical protein MJ227_04120 [Bacilli bacterium]|nr:hypothetical protein [Bacilli bacterium]